MLNYSKLIEQVEAKPDYSKLIQQVEAEDNPSPNEFAAGSTPLNKIDLTPADTTIDTSNMQSPADTVSTQPTEVELGKGTIDNPVYNTPDKIASDVTDAQTKAAEQGNSYVNPQTGKKELIPMEPGLPDASLETIPVGKLGWFASNPAKYTNLYDKVVDGIYEYGKSARGVDAAVRLIKTRTGKSEQEILDSVKDLDPKDKTIALAFGTKDKQLVGHIEEAIDDDNDLKTKLGSEVVKRKNIVQSVTQNMSDIKDASNKWTQMLDEANKVDAEYPLNIVADDLDYIDTLYGTAGGKGAILTNKLKMAAENGDKLKLGDALDLRKGINRLISKAPKGTDELTRLSRVKDQLDAFINTATMGKPELQTMIDDTISNYARVKNNVDFNSLVDASINDAGILNYKKLIKATKKAGLHSPEVDKAIDIAKMFQDKFNVDKYLSKAITPVGAKADGTGYIGVGLVLRWIVDHLTPYNRLFKNSRFRDLAIQKEIRNAIQNSSTVEEFLAKVEDNANIPLEMKQSLKQVEQPKQLEYKGPTSSATIDGEVKPLYSTSKGTTSVEPSQPALHDAQKEIVTNALKDAGHSTEVMNKVNNIVIQGNKRIENVMSDIANQIKHSDIVGNTKRLKATIDREVGILVDRINKDAGVKLPPEEVEKIVRMKLDKLGYSALGIASMGVADEYKVKSGDTASSIAKRNNITLKDLHNINKNIDLNKLKSGQTINVMYNAKDIPQGRDETFGAPTNYDVPDYIQDTEGFLDKVRDVMGKQTMGYGYDIEQNKAYMKDDFKAAGIKSIHDTINRQQASVLYHRASDRINKMASRVLGYDITNQGKYSPLLKALAYNGDINPHNGIGHKKAFNLLKRKKFSAAIKELKNINLSSNRLINRLKKLNL